MRQPATVNGQPGNGACGTCHAIPPTTGAHVRHTSTAITLAPECLSCHFSEDFDQTHQNGRVDVQFSAELGSDAAWREGTCTNVYCHSDGRGRFRDMSWTEATLTCAGCHDDETSENIRLSGRHAQHLRIGVACADCHGAVVTRLKTIVAPELHINGKIDVRVLAGRYAGGTCQPSCHDARGW